VSRHRIPPCVSRQPIERQATSWHFTDFPYTVSELDAPFALAREESAEQGGRYDTRTTMIYVWAPPRPESHRRMGAWAFQWGDPPRLSTISIEPGWTLTDLL
jgi:hypothetical protein